MARFNKYIYRQFWFYAKRAFYIFLAWVLISNIFFFYEYFTLKTEGVLDTTFDFKASFTANIIVGAIAGLIGGIVTVNLMEYWLRKYAFWKAILLICIVYLIAAYLVSAIGIFYFKADELGLPYFDEAVILEVKQFFGSWFFAKNLILWLFIVLSTIITLMVSNKYGSGVFADYLMGRYFMPKNERRIFMFADIKDATTIAEKLGEKQYFNFLKQFYKDIAPAIVQTRGEVYQYVGDEVVVSWKMRNGIKDGNALHCFFIMKQLIDNKSKKYTNMFGITPVFKTGFHYGSVMVGEIGKLKRDIAFSGDVLNTTSRIQAQCNTYGVLILASKAFSEICYKLPKGIIKKELGSAKLKGKAEEIELTTYINDDKLNK